ncbi:MAG TPA: DUF1573 domain-containing protein [Candidatus Nealsonbacteria bacterium]|uniref:DUF1573 domain-containing protein n=1 Tax=marine sediment metagenome TaxID=412755 RepID=A0A0F9UJS1_9ZZZZ|nr:DUF1573 domain-containing protein [Candidatus Nealsonbacteria bacterium]HEB46409.1 DUF1573 domain-containing protein [Candidatus Nealsonbacteria bacterium]
MRPVIFIVGSTFLIIVLLVFGLPYLDQKEGQGKIEVNPLEYDAGTISMAAGLIKHIYEIRNNGDSDLKIEDIRTSCMCTTAILKTGDKESPKFGMHNNPKFWSQKIAPGEIGFLEVTFDPAFHGPQGTGPVIRAIYLSTSDPDNQKIEIRLLVNVIP